MTTDNHGRGSVASNDWTPAQRIQEKHAAHPVDLEDASDEENHSRSAPSEHSLAQTQSLNGSKPTEEPSLKKAIGENSPRKDAKAKKVPIFDPKSEDAFPALGAGPKPQVGSPVAPTWGSNHPSSGSPPGLNGNGSPSTAAPSHSSTLAPGKLTPLSTNASQSGAVPTPRLIMPGKHNERIQLFPSQLRPRDQLKKPLVDIIRAINKKSMAVVHHKLGPNGSLIFEATGPPGPTRQAIIDVAKEVGSTQSVKIPIPISARGHVIGKQGASIQRIQKETGAKIHVPKVESSGLPRVGADDDSITIDVVIEGDAVSAESARKEIEAILNERTSTVDMRLHDGKGEIKGPEAKSELAKSKRQALRKELENEVTHVLQMSPIYHRDMIGARGSQVNRLQDRYHVRIQFPRAAKPVADGGSDVGGLRSSKPEQALDEVVIRGPKKGVDEAKDELLNLLQYTIDHSHTSTVSVSKSQLPSLIGTGGREVEKLRKETGAEINIPGHRDVSSPTGRAEIRIKGTKEQVEKAQKQLEERAETFDSKQK